MNEEKKNKKGGSVLKIFLILILLVVFAVAGWFGNEYYGKYINKTKTKSTSLSKKQNDENDKYEKIDVDSMINKLYENTKPSGLGPDEVLYKSKGMKVSEMDDNYKSRIAFKNFYRYFVKTSDGSFVDEKDVQYAYESIFGVGTFKSGQDVYNGCKGNLNYDTTKKRYTMDHGGCGGSTGISVIDAILEVNKNNKEMKIDVGVVFANGETQSLYKTYDDLVNKTNAIGTIKDLIGEDYVNTVEYSSDIKIKDYIIKNADKLQQYTYTFEMDKNGFYKYVEVKRTNE